MPSRIIITPTQADFAAWSRSFVPTPMLWWWDDSAIPSAELALRIVDRTDIRRDPIASEIRYVNAFNSWVMPKDVTRIVVDEGVWIDSLSAEERRHASYLQVRFHRGLCIQRGRFPANQVLPEAAQSDDRVALDHALWISLSESTKMSILKTELPEWDLDTTFPIPESSPAHIAGIANTFVHLEGVNCLSVTAFAITGNRGDLEQWMFPEVFVEVLDHAGFMPVEAGALQPNDALVFRDIDGNIAHAAFALASDRLLNKNGQTSFNPIAITDLETLKHDWANYAPEIYRRR